MYGKVANFVGSSLNDCPWRYASQYEDSETGLYYNRHRYYSPEMGGYLSQDPIGLAGNNPTLYAYVPDPNSWVDPFGLEFVTRRASFRAAKQQAGIPKSTQYTTHKYIYDDQYENRTVYEFDVDGKKKYVVLHEEDGFGRGKHFHGAEPNVKNPHNPMEPGKYNQLPGHHPENMDGFKINGCY
jgi:RHS repeat-associated protein